MRRLEGSAMLKENPAVKEHAMGMMDKIKSMLKGHEQQTDKGIDRGGDYVDERTQGKYRGQVDTGQEKMREQLGDQDRGPDQPPR
jgi:hypothetical protein